MVPTIVKNGMLLDVDWMPYLQADSLKSHYQNHYKTPVTLKTS
jgi:hypothetical protein